MTRTWKLLTVPGIGVSLLPKLACPLCWPAYAGLLSSVGLGFLMSAKYLLPFTGIFLLFTVGALALRAKHRHGYGPFVLGTLSAVGVLIGKFAWESNRTTYATIGLLVSASAWNAWPHRIAATSACCAEKQIN